MKRTSRHGFTLIELSIVIMLLATLFTVMFSTFFSVSRIASTASPRSRELAGALEERLGDDGEQPVLVVVDARGGKPEAFAATVVAARGVARASARLALNAAPSVGQERVMLGVVAAEDDAGVEWGGEAPFRYLCSHGGVCGSGVQVAAGGVGRVKEDGARPVAA